MFRKFLFVSWTSRNERPYFDPSVRYRCYNFASELIRRGHSASVISQQRFQVVYNELPDFDVYVFHRPYLTQELCDFLLDIRENRVAVADFDDLIFDVRHAHMTPMVRVRGADSRSVRSYIAKTHDAASLFKNFSLSTSPLREHVEESFPGSKAIVVSNSIDPGFIGLSRVARKTNPIEKRPYSLGYFSGTATHDKDFSMVAPYVCDYLRATGGRILIVGPLQMPDLLLELGDQVVTKPLVSFHELANTMAKCATVLAPLESTIFTRSKSGLKFFEAALAGCDVIATPIPDIDRFDSPLLHKCRTPDEWEAALNCKRLEGAIERETEIARIEHLVSPSTQVDKFLSNFLSRKYA